MEFIPALLLVLVTAKLMGELVERTGYPSMIGEILAGIILGPAVLGLVDPTPELESFAELGIIALLFISGIELNLAGFARARNTAAATAAGGIIVPLAAGWLLGALFSLTDIETLFLAITLSITSIGISVRTLIDLKRLTGDVGATIIAAAVYDDVIGIVLLGVLTAASTHSGSAWDGLVPVIGFAVIFIVAAATVGRKAVPWLFSLARKSETHEMSYSAAIIIALLLAWLAQAAHLHYTIGAFVAGLLLGDVVRKDRTLLDSLTDFGFGFMITLFFASVGLHVSVPWSDLATPLLLPLFLLAVASKFAGGFAGSAYFLGIKRAALVGIGICPRGEIALVVAKVALASGIIAAGLYASVTFMVIATIFATPLLLKAGFPRLDQDQPQEAPRSPEETQ
jgi:Kef-type K+ transport system membrane component KefB